MHRKDRVQQGNCSNLAAPAVAAQALTLARRMFLAKYTLHGVFFQANEN